MKKLVEKDFIDQMHDNKMWAVKFNFDGGQVLIKDYLELDIDYVINVDSSIGDGIVFHICPAKIIFECVSSFNINCLPILNRKAILMQIAYTSWK
ncbi:hypothetical protein [Escherichia coli]|uniref:hypothetical protein n=1 Tax=Escherichia coli TaxID=562 RepID=UPI00388DF4E4